MNGTGEDADHHRPSVSVVIPAYNAERSIGGAITSVLTQTYPHVQIVVVDDGSTDRTEAICRAYGDLITYRRQPNGGSASARNLALAVATGDLIATLDADDELLPPYLEAAVATWERAGRGRHAVMCNNLLLTSTGIGHGRTNRGMGTPGPERQRLAILHRNFVGIQTLFPAVLGRELGGWDESLHYREDWDWWIRAIHAGWVVVYQDEPHALYRWHPDAKSLKTQGYEAETALLARFLSTHRLSLRPDEVAYLEKRVKATSPRLLNLRGDQALRRGDYAVAAAAFTQAADLDPSNRKLRVKAVSVARIPGTAALWRARLQRIDAALGRDDDEQR